MKVCSFERKGPDASFDTLLDSLRCPKNFLEEFQVKLFLLKPHPKDSLMDLCWSLVRVKLMSKMKSSRNKKENVFSMCPTTLKVCSSEREDPDASFDNLLDDL